jgi:hypothetical protein
LPGTDNQAVFGAQAGTGSHPATGHEGPVPPAQGALSPDLALPPWARVPAELSAATAPADLPDWAKGTGSGPMYVWDPATNSGPFPALNPEDE